MLQSIRLNQLMGKAGSVLGTTGGELVMERRMLWKLLYIMDETSHSLNSRLTHHLYVYLMHHYTIWLVAIPTGCITASNFWRNPYALCSVCVCVFVSCVWSELWCLLWDSVVPFFSKSEVLKPQPGPGCVCVCVSHDFRAAQFLQVRHALIHVETHTHTQW